MTDCTSVCTNTKEEELFSAYSSGDIDGVISLIDTGASPFTTDDKGNTLFHLCCSDCTNNTDGPRVLQSLITASISITATPFLSVISSVNNDGNTPLHLACSNGLTECVQLFLSHFPVIFNVVTDDMIQCITDAASWEIVQLLLNKITLRGLMDTCNKCEHIRHFLGLFPKNNEHFQLSDGKTTLLHLVATSGDLEYFTATVSIWLDINCFDNEGYTPLHRAIEYGCVSIAKYLINQPNCLRETLSYKYTAPLHDAAGEYGAVSIVQCLVERGVDINVSSFASAVTPLHYSCRWGHLSIVEYLTSLPQFNYTRDSWGRTGIHYAAEFGQVHVVKYLTEVRGYDINVEDKYGNTPLYIACMYDHLPVVEYLTAQPNCDINSNNNESHPLIVATDKELLNIVKHLIDSKVCDINVREKTTESTPLHKACYNGSLSIVEYLISKPECNIEARDSKGKQSLYYAVRLGYKEIILLLSEKISMDGLSECIRLAEMQAQPEIIEILKKRYRLLQDSSKSNRNLLLDACESGHIDIIRHLVIDKHCDINAKGSGGYTPLHYACKNGHFEIVKILTDHPECNIEAENNYKGRAVHVACESGHVDIVRHLVIDKRCDINAKGLGGYTPLHYACEKGNYEIVKILTEHPECNVEAEDNCKDRAAHAACKSGHVDIVRHLVIDKRCDINAKGLGGYTPLHYACERGKYEIFKILTDHPECNIEAENNYYKSRAVHTACRSGHVDIVRHLVIDKHCDINAKGLGGYTPLHYACEKGNYEIVKILTDHPECNIEAENNYEDRAVHAACKSGHVDIVRHLVIDKHCDINAKGLGSYTPLRYACEKGNYEIVKILTEHPECNVEAEDNCKGRAVHAACKLGHVDIVRHLVIDKHCDINAKGLGSYTPLCYACEKGNYEIFKILTEHPECNVEAEDNCKGRAVHVACKLGHVDIVRHLVIDKHCDINAKGLGGYKALHYACKKGNYEIVKILTEHPECNVEAENNYKDRAVHAACESGHVDTVRHLVIDKHCDINAKGSGGCTPLHYACKKGNFEIVKILTDHPECDIEAEDNYKGRAVHTACRSGHVDTVRHLVIDKRCDINAKDSGGCTPLHYACEKDNFEIVKILTDHPECDIEAEDNYKGRAVHTACESGHVDTVRHLVIDKHCDINAKGSGGYTPLHYACEKGNYEIVKILTEHPECNLEAENNCKGRAVHAACESGHMGIVRHLLIDKHCDINAKGSGGYTPLHYACKNGHFEIVKILTDHPECNIKAEDNSNNRALHVACQSAWHDTTDIVRHLVIDKHCDINAKGLGGYTPLHYACEKGNYEIVKILTEHPECNIKAEDNSNNRALHVACQSAWHGTTDIVHHLVIDKHCDINAKGSGGCTPLHYACEKGHFEIVKILTDNPKCNIEAEDISNNRALHVACKSRHYTTDIVRHLVITKHCDINAKGSDGYTPLHYACKKGHFETVKFLTANDLKCDMEAENRFHRTPLQVALDYRRSSEWMKTIAIKIMKYLVEIKGCRIDGIANSDPMILHQSSGIALLRVVKCILTGPPGAGKSTLKKRLLNQSLDTEPSLSTGVVDAAVQVNSFRKLSQHNAVATTEWKEQELDEEAVLITKKLLPSNVTSDRSIASQFTLSLDSTISSSVPPEETDQPLATVEHNTSANSSPIEARKITTGETSSMEHENENTTDIVNDDEEEGVTDIQVQDSSSTVVSGLLKYLMSIPSRRRKDYEKNFEDLKDEDHTMLHIIDTGGQPEFHEILPALITGPAINLLVFKLTEDLRSRYKIIYRSPTGESNPYETSLTHEEVIFRSLASIACLRQNTIGWSFDKAPIEDKSEPVAFLIATHRDQVEENKINEVNQQLKTKIENSSHLFHSNLVQFSRSDQVIFPLDTTKDEEEIKYLCSILHRVISERFHELQIPASWCALSLKLRKRKQKLFKYDTCFQLAQDCGIKNKKDFQNALWYLHHRVGIIMYYPNVKGLEDIIITDLQLVFDRITNLITTCFTFERSGSAAVEKEFRKNGRFSESQLDEISLREKGDPLNSKRLVALLKHLYIVAGPMKTKVGRKNVNYYFMPCALKPADVEREERDKSLSPSPLLICFKCGYTPVGVFCCLVVYLLDQKTDQVLQWKLTGNDQYRNKINFKVGQYLDTVVLISRATYLEVWVQQVKGSKLSTNDLCDKILSSLHKGLEAVTQSLHYTYKSRHMFGVPCTACPAGSVPHPAVIEFNEEVAECNNGNIMILNEEQLHWSKKVC